MLRSKFPIGESICGVRLKHVAFSREPLGVTITFEKGKSRLTTNVLFPKRSVWKDDVHKELTRVTLLLESLFLVFLSPSDVVSAKSSSAESAAERLEEYIDNINRELHRVNAFEEDLCLKTIPDKSGNASLPRYVAYGNHFWPFVKKEDDDTRVLKYSQFEKQLLCH